jgi:hypothetical protein
VLSGGRPDPSADVHLSKLTNMARSAKLALPCAPGRVRPFSRGNCAPGCFSGWDRQRKETPPPS